MLKVGTLFSGIETPIMALQKSGIRFSHELSCENDGFCRKVIEARFSPKVLYGDINEVDVSAMPHCDLIVAGVPCQAFSIAGHQRGLSDRRGRLFDRFAEVLSASRPKMFIMENVLGLLSHNGKKTFAYMLGRIKDAGYSAWHAVLQSSDYGIPQMRRRVYVVGVLGESEKPLERFPPGPRPLLYTLDQVMGGKVERSLAWTLRVGGRGSPYGDRHNWDSYKVDGKVVRLTVEQACRLQGIRPDFYDGLDVPESEKFKQVGNAMTVDVVGAAIKSLLDGTETKSDLFRKD